MSQRPAAGQSRVAGQRMAVTLKSLALMNLELTTPGLTTPGPTNLALTMPGGRAWADPATLASASRESDSDEEALVAVD